MAKHETLEHADIYETCTGYLEQVADGHLSFYDAWDAILDKIAHLDDDAACEINRLCFEYEQQHMPNLRQGRRTERTQS